MNVVIAIIALTVGVLSFLMCMTVTHGYEASRDRREK